GGFLMFDDFEMGQWNNMAAQVGRALPEYSWVEIDDTHPIFRSFFRVGDIYVPHPLVAVTPVYQAIFEDNDPTKRIMVLANHNSDLAEYWEWSTQGMFGVDMTNDRLSPGGELHRVCDDSLSAERRLEPGASRKGGTAAKVFDGCR